MRRCRLKEMLRVVQLIIRHCGSVVSYWAYQNVNSVLCIISKWEVDHFHDPDNDQRRSMSQCAHVSQRTFYYKQLYAQNINFYYFEPYFHQTEITLQF